MNTKIIALATKFKSLRTEEQKATDFVKKIKGELDEVEKELLDSMVEDGVNSVDIDGLGKFSMRTTNYLSVNAANKPHFIDYLKSSGNGSIVKEDVNSRTLTAFLRGHLEELIKDEMSRGTDEVDSRKNALEFLNKKGASYFTERGIAFKGE